MAVSLCRCWPGGITMAEITSVGALLRAHRRAMNMTMEELAEASGVSVRAISDMELGHRSPASMASW
uniref:helix-turn-helix domain-containing protein n=1 Tax=Planotetraspora phitsanulokensis TaxID=575192 RepID=UPI003570DCFA